jgi:hypothetical protein
MAPQDVIHWKQFEDLVAQIYRVGGASVKQNVNLGGNQIDVYFEEETVTGQTVRTAVECKYYATAVQEDAILQFASVADLLRRSNLIDRAVLVTYRGYTRQARVLAQAANIDLRTFQELETRVSPDTLQARVIQNVSSRPSLPDEFPNLAFVVMPFDESLQDIYLYGIRGACERVGLQCKRADEIEHGGPIVEEVLDHVKRAKVVIAELSAHNPNVFYEIGWAHALGRTTVLLAKAGTRLPFDVGHINTLFYSSIKDLEDRLVGRLQSLVP